MRFGAGGGTGSSHVSFITANFFTTITATVKVNLIGSQTGQGLELRRQNVMVRPLTFSDLTAIITDNSASINHEIAYRLNSADGNQLLTILAGITGEVSDLVNTDDVVAGDLIAYDMRFLGGTGSYRFGSVSMRID